MGEYDHNLVQRAILFWIYAREREWRVRSIQEQRMRVDPNKVRIPDVGVFSRDVPVDQVFTRPPLIVVEVLSPEDRHSRMDEKIRDYLAFGVQSVWIVDPATRSGRDCTTGDWVRKEHFTIAGSPMYLSLPELFAKLDEESM